VADSCHHAEDELPGARSGPTHRGATSHPKRPSPPGRSSLEVTECKFLASLRPPQPQVRRLAARRPLKDAVRAVLLRGVGHTTVGPPDRECRPLTQRPSAEAQCCLTLRSRGAPTARHQALATGTVYIVCGQGLASLRRRPLTSNVRPQMAAATLSRENECRGSTRTTVTPATFPECAASLPAVRTSTGLRENVRCHAKGHDRHHPASSRQPRDCDRPRQDTQATVATSWQRHSPRRSALKVARRPSRRFVLSCTHRRSSQSAVRHHRQARSGPPEEGALFIITSTRGPSHETEA